MLKLLYRTVICLVCLTIYQECMAAISIKEALRTIRAAAQLLYSPPIKLYISVAEHDDSTIAQKIRLCKQRYKLCELIASRCKALKTSA